MIADAIGLENANPPSCTGLSSKSPTVAPSGRVKMKAAQNNMTRDTSVRPAVKDRQDRQRGAKYHCATGIAKAGAVRRPIAKRSAQGLRKRNRGPIENFDLGRGNRRDGNRTLRPEPERKRSQHERKQKCRSAGIAYSQRAIGKVGHCRAEGGGGDNCRPVQKRPKFVRHDLQCDKDDQSGGKDRGASQI